MNRRCLLGRIPIPEDLITHVAFGGRDCKTLYVTAGKKRAKKRGQRELEGRNRLCCERAPNSIDTLSSF